MKVGLPLTSYWACLSTMKKLTGRSAMSTLRENGDILKKHGKPEY